MAVKEGKWDCEFCGAVNPGSEMKCTSCGSVRGENVKFYLEEDAAEVTDQEKLVQARGGADWHCAYCGTDNRAGAEKCRQCGAPREGMESRKETIIPQNGEEPPSGGGTKPPPAPKPKRKLPLFIGAAVVIVVAVLLFLVARGTEAGLVVESGQWTRTIAVEEQQWIGYEKWEDEIPGDARILRSWEDQRGTEKVQIGTERVKTGTKDLGNGFFEDVFEERPIYEDRPVYDTKVEYEVQEWREIRQMTASGGLGGVPVWPTVNLGVGEREGSKTEEAELTFISTDPEEEGKKFTYNKLSPQELDKFSPGQKVNAMVSGSRVQRLLEDEE